MYIRKKIGKLTGIFLVISLLLMSVASAITVEEVALHDTASDCWMIVDTGVYDVTSFIPSHPGGSAMIPYCGGDGSAPFAAIHQAATSDLLPTYYIGPLTTAPVNGVVDMRITPPAGSIVVGESIALVATPLDVNGNPVAEPVTWDSTDASVASVIDGDVLGLAPGKTIITATIGGVNAATTITVSEDLSYTLAELATHNTRTDCWFAVAGKVYDVTDIVPVHPTELGPFCGMDTSFAFYDASHKPTAGFFLLTDFLIGSIAPETVLTTVNVADVTMQTGSTKTLLAETLDQYGYMFIPESETWTSADSSIASVAADGTVTAVAAGMTTITYTATGKGVTMSGTLDVEVSDDAAVLDSIVVLSRAPRTTPGNVAMFMATAYDQYGNELALPLVWEVADSSVGVVNNGVFTGVNVGTTTVTASSGAVSGSAQVFVQDPVLSKITVDPFALNMNIGDVEQLNEQALDQAGNLIAASIVWSTTDASIAAVDQNGLVTAVGPGTAHIRAVSGAIDRTTIAIVTDLLVTPQELATHNTRADCWMSINEKIYDATSFAPIHPAGDIIYSECGANATDVFRGIHSTGQRLVNLFYIGTLDTTTPPTNGGGDDDEHEEEDEEDDERDEDDRDEDEEDESDEDEDNEGSELISMSEAVSIVKDALNLDSAEVKEAKIENDGGRQIWKLKLKAAGEEYEAKIDARTGAILKLE